MEHLFLDDRHRKKQNFTSYGSGGGRTPIFRTREQHAARLLREYEQALLVTDESANGPQTVTSHKNGVRISFAIRRGYEDCISGLTKESSGIRIRTIIPGTGNLEHVVIVSVWVPNNEVQFFTKKIREYEQIDNLSMIINPENGERLKAIAKGQRDFKRAITRLVGSGDTKFYVQVPTSRRDDFIRLVGDLINPSQIESIPGLSPLITSIELITTHILEHCCTLGHVPGDYPEWTEVWLATEGGEELPMSVRESDPQFTAEIRFRELAQERGLRVSNERLIFPERVVLLAEINRHQAQRLLIDSEDIAEFRPAESITGFMYRQSNRDQSAWIADIQSRIQAPDITAPAVCILDTGVNRNHPMLEPVLNHNDCHTVRPHPTSDWGVDDHEGHGSEMAGIAIYGDIEKLLPSSDPITIQHRLESVKLLPPSGQNERHLWADLTDQAVALAESANSESAQRVRCFSLAITSEHPEDCTHSGQPTSWSGGIDQIAYGKRDEERRLFIISAGNTNGDDFPERNFVSSIQSPGQSWNAITVGAYTERMGFDTSRFPDHKPLASIGDLCPFTTTAKQWQSKWPNKPDVVFEGGNLLIDSLGRKSDPEDLWLLTTSRTPTNKPFSITNGTSAATALGSHFAAKLMAAYPQAWPETIRALMIHSAEWTEQMRRRFLMRGNRTEYADMLRVVGYGVPNLDRALTCGQNKLTLIAQETLRPYKKEKSKGKTNQMHLHKFPWPKEELLRLGDAEVSLRVTLSYFIDPSPEGRAWTQRYRYQSHGLRFALKRPGQSEQEFLQNINAEVMEDEDGIESVTGGSSGIEDRWLIGTQSRHRGSIHSDIIPRGRLTAADLSDVDVLAVFPVIGWIRERLKANRINEEIRYSLVVSIETPVIDTDLYIPVRNKILVPVSTIIET
jgi:hypothetical protein